MPEFPKIIRQGDHVFLLGELAMPIRLFGLSQFATRATENVQQAIQTSTSCAVFIGAQHLQALAVNKPSQPCIVIEPNRLLANALSETAKVQGITLITAEWGEMPPAMNLSFFPTLLAQEMGLIALQLMQLPDAWFTNPRVYTLTEGQAVSNFSEHLEQTLALVLAAKKYHFDRNPLYEKFKQQPRGQASVILTNTQEITPENFRYFSFAPGPYTVLSIANQNHARLVAPSLKPQAFTFDSQAYDHFLEQLVTVNPTIVLMNNRAPFLVLADMLIYEEMFRRLDLPLTSYFTDWFSHMGQTYHGGWSFLLHDELWPEANKKYLTPYPAQSSLSLPKTPIHFEPLAYASKDTLCQMPATATEIVRDVAIVHQTRWLLRSIPEVNELFDFLHTDPNDAIGYQLNRALYLTRQRLKNDPWPLANSYFWRSLLNSIEFITYGLLRMNNVVLTVQALSGLKVTVYGEDWQKLLPQEVCGGSIAFDDLPAIYRSSHVTLDVTQTFAPITPHANALDALKAGGYPILLDALFPTQKTEHAFIQNLPRFKNFSDLAPKVRSIVQNPRERNDQILKLQNQLLEWNLGASTNKNTPLPKAEEAFDTHVTPQDETTLEVFIGYLLCLSGESKAAVDFWSHAIFEKNVRAPQVLERCRLTANTLGLKDLASALEKLN